LRSFHSSQEFRYPVTFVHAIDRFGSDSTDLAKGDASISVRYALQ
jgi:hypothetical protein